MIPHLKLRTEFSFRSAYGPVSAVADHLAAIECDVAGIVDVGGGTWGHIAWEKELTKRGIAPLFGAEFPILRDDARSPDGRRLQPPAWCLARNMRQFYHFTSTKPTTQEAWANAEGIVRFCGAGLSDPDAFDYVDINPQSLVVVESNLAIAHMHGKPLVLTCDNNYPGPSDRDKFLAMIDRKQTTMQHIPSDEEFRRQFWFLSDKVYKEALENTIELAESLRGLKLEKAPLIDVPGDLWALVDEGMRYRVTAGHIKEWTVEHETRLLREMSMIEKKQFQSYFIVVADLVRWAKDRMLVGPARGSSAGSLVCYLLRITEVDPLPHHLLFERFIDINRDDLPDIDIDFNDQKRELCFDYLIERYGRANVARIGSINTLKPRSVMAEVGKRLGVPIAATYAVKNVLIEYSSGDSRYGKGLEDTMTNTGPGREFTAKYPEAALMGEVEGHAWHTGQHAAGIIVSNNEVTNYCTVQDGIAQLDKYGAEYLNLLKIDALGLRTLGVIEDTGCITPDELYGLKLDDPKVFQIFNDCKFSGLFQFEGAAQRRVSMTVPIVSFQQIDHVTALARPGPLGGGAANTYINRNKGKEPITYRHPSMAEYLDDTMGVVLYQEQVMRIVREIGKFTWEETSVIRKAMSGRKGKEFFDQRGAAFVKGAAELGISEDDAHAIWNEICSFGAWGMNKSHTCSYAIISYWCAYMKCYHPLEYAAACMRNAKDEDQEVEILRELESEGVHYIPFDIDLSDKTWTTKDGALIGGFMNLVGIGPAKAAMYIEKRNAGTLTDKDRAAIAKCAVKNGDLRPAHTKYGHLYDNPRLVKVWEPIKEFGDLKDKETAVVLCKLVRKERRDENEAVRLANRGGELRTGVTNFLDAFVTDDSVSKPVLLRLPTKLWNTYGERLADNGRDGVDWFLVRGMWLQQFVMFRVTKMHCLTDEDFFK